MTSALRTPLPDDSGGAKPADGTAAVGARADETASTRISYPGVIGGRYKVLGKIAEGGMGAVYKAEHVLSKKRLALKILHPHLCHGRQAVERFRREVSAAAEIDHPGIVQVFDAGVDTDGSFYMAMELLEGESLAARMKREWPGTRTSVALVLELLESLARAHEKGFIHRDLKPDNVFLAKDHELEGGRERVKLLDFGLAREITRKGPTMSGITFGTPEYMAPEQAMSAKRAIPQSDVWSVGVMLYELVSGKHPFSGDTPNAVMANAIKEPHIPVLLAAPHIPRALGEIIESCLDKDPTARPVLAGDLREALVELTSRIELDDQRPEIAALPAESEEPHDDDRIPSAISTAIPIPLDRALEAAAAREPAQRPAPASGRSSPSSTQKRRWVAWGAVTAAGAVLAAAVAYIGVTAARRGATTHIEVPVHPSAVAATSAMPALDEATRVIVDAPVVEEVAPVVEGAATTEAVTPAEETESEAARVRTPRRRATSISDEERAEAQSCMRRGDTRCALGILSRSGAAADQALVISLYEAQGRTAEARRAMQSFVRRFPTSADAARFRSQLARHGD